MSKNDDEVKSKGRGGRVAYESSPKHHDGLRRVELRVKNARKALEAAEQDRYEKILAALNDGVKPSAVARSLGSPYITVQRAVNRARRDGDLKA